MASRGGYVEAGNSAETAAAFLRCHNELLIVVENQMLADLDPSFDGYPDDNFLKVLTEKSSRGGCEENLNWALNRALEFSARGSAQ
jgi:hypothetical protein